MTFNLDFSEDGLVEQPSIDLLESLGWNFMSCLEDLVRMASSVSEYWLCSL